MRSFRILLLCCAIVPCAALAQNGGNTGWATPNSPATKAQPNTMPLEIAIGYSYLRSNANPGQCGCFNMNGGNVQAALHLYRGFSFVADLTGETAASVQNVGLGLSLVSFTAGPRFSHSFRRRFTPFAQSLFGAVHGFDSYFPVAAGPTGAATDFAMIAGGGLDIPISRRLAIRPIEADDLLTRLPNGGNNVENNLRLSAGLVIRIR